jgi:ribosomal protein L5
LLKISKTAYAHTARHMREFTGKKPMRLDRRNKVQIPFALRSQMTFRLLRDSSQ